MIVKFLLCSLALFTIVLARYFLFSGAAYLFLWKWKNGPFARRRLVEAPLMKGQVASEIGYSISTSIVFAISGAILVFGREAGLVKFYVDPFQYGLWYLPASFAILMLIHETYFYWTHRLLHSRWLFRRVHYVHHLSSTTTPWTAFSFHPLEAVVQALVPSVLVFFFPVNVFVFFAFLLVMTVLGVINHSNYEIYPHEPIVGKFVISATHHSLHHKRMLGNYGLYFTFWDKFVRSEIRAIQH